MREVEEVMRIRHGLRLDEPNDFDLVTQDAILAFLDQITQAAFLALVVLSSIALMVGGIGVMSIMTISVTERTREIGVRKALGARRVEILWQFLLEAVFLTRPAACSASSSAAAIGLGINWSPASPSRCPGGRSPSASASRPASASSSAWCPRSGRRASIPSRRCATSRASSGYGTRYEVGGSDEPALILLPSVASLRYVSRSGGGSPMKVFDAAGIRNVALVGHSGAGKTQLVSALLLDAGAVNRFGKVDEGTTVTDYDEEAIARKHTLAASLAYLEWNKQKINLIDTPGMGNFLTDARAALRVAEAAVVVVDAVSGVQVSTEKVWAAADELQLPRLIVCNRLDRDRASLDARARIDADRARPQLRARADADRRGTAVQGRRRPRRDEGVHVRRRRVGQDDGGRRAGRPEADGRQAARDGLIEMVAEADDALMEKFFEPAR